MPLDNIDSGPDATRPPAIPANKDKFWYSSDTQGLYVSTGTAWVLVGGPGSGGGGGPAVDLGTYFDTDLVNPIPVDQSPHDVNTSTVQQMAITNPSATDSMLVLVSFHIPAVGFASNDIGIVYSIRTATFSLDGAISSEFFGTSNVVGFAGQPVHTSGTGNYVGRVILTPSQSIFAEISDTIQMVNQSGVTNPLEEATTTLISGTDGWSIHATGWVV